jgi:hypothetical protein
MTFDQVGKRVAVFTTMCSRLARLLQCFLDDSFYSSLVGGVSSLLEWSLFVCHLDSSTFVVTCRKHA